MDFLEKNIGKKDRQIRLGVGAVFALLALLGWIGWWGWLIAFIGLVTGALNSCPVYTLLDKDSLE